MLNGIDVSNVNGTVDWESWRGKIDFAGIKVSEGLNFTDQYAAANVAGARSIGAVPMAYHFLRATLPGISQARYFLDKAYAAGIGPGCLVMLDVETIDGMPVLQVSECAASFADEVHSLTGAWPVAYTDQSFALGGYVAALGVCPAFIANPSGVVLPVPIGPWRLVSFEQVSQRGTDLDVFYGTPEQLAALAIPHPAPPADWTFYPVRYLEVTATGPHSVKVSWYAPAGPAPEAVHHYQLTVRHLGEDVTKPVDVVKGPNPEVYQWNDLTPGTDYELLVRAVAVNGHASPWAAVTFRTTPG